MKYSLFLAGTFVAASLSFAAMDTFAQTKEQPKETPFNVTAEAFADLQLLRYQVPGFDELSRQQKKLLYYLSEAALAGRDIIYDQKGKYNLLVRKTLENIYATYKGGRKAADWKKFTTYAGQVWFSNGIHHHYGNEKFVPE